jgi:hypothetical protein
MEEKYLTPEKESRGGRLALSCSRTSKFKDLVSAVLGESVRKYTR